MTRTRSSADLSPRLVPPQTLSAPESKLFRMIVAAVGSDHFTRADAPLLVEYARATCLADQAAVALAADGAVVDGRASPWIVVQEKCVRSMTALAARLRLCPQSRLDRTVAGKTARTGVPFPDPDDGRPTTGLASFRKTTGLASFR